MAPLDALPEGWVVWNEEPGGRVVLVFRPDVFDSSSFPPACLPTLSVAPGSSPDRPAGRRDRTDSWHVALYLEPAVRVRGLDAAYGSRDRALEGAVEAATRFADGRVDYRAAYADPREAYLEELDDLTGSD